MGFRSALYHGVPDQVQNPYPPLVLCHVLRCQCLLQRREGEAPLLSLQLFPCVRNESFYCKDDPRPGRLPRLYESWEMPACFYPRVPLVELPLVGD